MNDDTIPMLPPTITRFEVEGLLRETWIIFRGTDKGIVYLHTDGVWREATLHQSRASGHFNSKKLAEDTLKKFADK